jgi:hypothetical protein
MLLGTEEEKGERCESIATYFPRFPTGEFVKSVAFSGASPKF